MAVFVCKGGYENRMQIKVMHREQCFAAAGGYGQEYNTENITIPTMIISISCLDKAIPNRLEKYRRENKNIINVAYVQFDDIDSSETINGETPMSKSDAKTIVDAFMKYKDRVEQIIVHCDAGYSRSPAVAAALAKALDMSDEVYFSSGQYCPNRHVYRMMMNELAARNFFDWKEERKFMKTFILENIYMSDMSNPSV